MTQLADRGELRSYRHEGFWYAMDTVRDRTTCRSCGPRARRRGRSGTRPRRSGRGRRVLLTGHTGFKGGWLALWLRVAGGGGARASRWRRRPRRRCSSSRAWATTCGRSRATCATPRRVRARCALPRPTVVLHLAAQPLVRLSYEEPVATYDDQRDGHGERARGRARRRAPLHSVVVVTSDKCYLNPERDKPFARATRSAGTTPTRARRRAPSSCPPRTATRYRLPIATGRAGNVIGGGDFSPDRLVPDAMRAVAARRAAARAQPRRDPALAARAVLAARLPAAGRARRAGAVELRPRRRRGAARALGRRAPGRRVGGRLRRPPARGALPEARLDQGAHAARVVAAVGSGARARRDGRVVRGAPRGSRRAAGPARSDRGVRGS